MIMILEGFADKDQFLEFYDFKQIHNLTIHSLSNLKIKQIKRILRSESNLKPKIVEHLNPHLSSILQLVTTLVKKYS